MKTGRIIPEILKKPLDIDDMYVIIEAYNQPLYLGD